MVFTKNDEADKDTAEQKKGFAWQFSDSDNDDEDEGDDADKDNDDKKSKSKDDDDEDNDDDEKEKLKNKVGYLQRKIRDNRAQDSALQTEADKINADHNYFIKLYEKNPEKAQKVLDKFFKGDNADDVYNLLTGGDNKSDRKWREETIDEAIDRREANKELRSLIKEYKVDPESKFYKKLMAEYEDLTEGKKLNAEKARKYFKMAFKELKGVDEQYDESQKNSDFLGFGSSTKKGNPSNVEQSFFSKKTTMDSWYPQKKK